MTRAIRLTLVLASIAVTASGARAQSTSPGWSVRATDHFDIYFQPAASDRVNAIAREAERAYARIGNLLRYELAAKMDVIVLRTDREVPRNATEAAALVRASGASTRDHLLLSIEAFDGRGNAVIAHELTHQFMFELLPDWQRAGWVAEGLSDLHAGSWESSELAFLRTAITAGQVPPVESLTASDRHWGHAVFDFIATEYGARGVRAYLAALRDSPAAMRDPIRVAFDTTPDDFNAAFRAFVTARFGVR